MKVTFYLLLLSASMGLCQAQTACPEYNADKIMQYAHTNNTADMVMVSAHRGLWEYVPENSPAAVSAATQACIEMSEVDARLSSDNQPVMLHDAYVDRTTTGHGLAYDLSFSQWTSLYLRDRLAVQTTTPTPKLDDYLDQLAAALKTNIQYVLVIDCKDTLTIALPSGHAALPTSLDVLKVVYPAIASYEFSHNLGTSLRDHIIFKVRFPELATHPLQAMLFTHWGSRTATRIKLRRART
jgi:hypothetical protein